MTTATHHATPTTLRLIRHRLIEARLGLLADADLHYAQDVATLLSLLEDARTSATSARRAIRIENRLRLR